MSLSKTFIATLIWGFFLLPINSWSQNFTSYFTGNSNDVVTNPSGGICLMGGATEDDYAMKWFLQQANGGDVLVLRTSGSNGYNSYLYSALGVNVNSVETIVCNNPLASAEAYVLQKIQQAEAIWFAGGDQWNYVSYWRNTAVDSLINEGIQQRHIVIGGTSAGMAIQGKYYFSAQNGTVTSADALSNPYHPSVTVDSTAFIHHPILHNVITDTHFDNPDRRGRLSTFLARMLTTYNIQGKAIACDEYTAVCIDTNGMAKVFGGYPAYDDNAYFIQTNCELSSQNPETCIANTPLTWNLGGEALKVYRIKGDSMANNSFNLNTWANANGGQWLKWSVNTGVFSEQSGSAINCNPLVIPGYANATFEIFPNPASDKLFIQSEDLKVDYAALKIWTPMGQSVKTRITSNSPTQLEMDISNLPNGFYFIQFRLNSGLVVNQSFLKNN